MEVVITTLTRKTFALALALLLCSVAHSQGLFTVSGRVLDGKGDTPLAGVVVNIDELWAVSDENGNFSIKRIEGGSYTLKASLLGYADYSCETDIRKNISGLVIRLNESSLALDEVLVTARRESTGTGTAHNIGRDALNHLQLSNLTDMAALLPGGKTTNPDLTSENSFSIRSAGSTAGNAAFSTAVEVDGVRLGNNAGFSGLDGVDTRSVAVDNVESVEVISGVPSVEYGDLGSGMVRIHTKRGRTPLNVSFTVNPRTKQTSVSKGVSLGGNAGILNLSAEWAEATKKLTSPYESYTRRGLSATYSNTFSDALRFEAGITGNIGGMNSEDDPDAFSGEYTKVRDNVLRANTSLSWQLNRVWITALNFSAFANYNDNLSHYHKYNSAASMLPAVHAEEEGYHLADLLPAGEYYSDQMVDSRELDYGASLKYTVDTRFGENKSAFKSGLQWNANGNVGEGEYYTDPSLAPSGYRPRPYSDYPFMNTFSAYAEEDFTFNFGLRLTGGLRMDKVFINGTRYDNTTTLSPRFNAQWKISKRFSLRAGWGVSEKLPSFYILYPSQEYRDILVSSGNSDGTPYYGYYTIPYTTEYNPDLKWQRNENAEIGIDAEIAGVSLSLVGYTNITKNPYKFSNNYTRVVLERELGGETFTDYTFVGVKRQDNGAPIYRSGVELTADFPEIKPIKTSVRVDAAYGYYKTEDDGLYYYYNSGWSHTSIANRSYQYVGVYANGGNSSLMIKGKVASSLDANLTTITHIPQARIIITCRVEASIFRRSRNIATGGEDVLYPVAYLDVEDETLTLHPFTEEDKSDDRFRDLIIEPSNSYTFAQDGYGAYASANLSVTKEIGSHVSLSFFANNFTNARPYVVSKATGVGAIFTPSFYYGLSCRIKL